MVCVEVVDVQDNEVRVAVVVDVSDCDRRPLIPEGTPVRNVLPGGPAPDLPGRVEPAPIRNRPSLAATLPLSAHLEDHEGEALRPEVGHRDAGTLVLIGGPVGDRGPRPPRVDLALGVEIETHPVKRSVRPSRRGVHPQHDHVLRAIPFRLPMATLAPWFSQELQSGTVEKGSAHIVVHPPASSRESGGSRTPSRHGTKAVAAFRIFNRHNKCTGVCRFVHGIPVGIGRRVAGLWVSVGFAQASGWPRPTAAEYPGTAAPRIPMTTFGNSASPKCLPACG